LKKEEVSEKKLEEVNREIADLEEEAKQFEARWKAEKELVNKIKDLKEK